MSATVPLGRPDIRPPERTEAAVLAEFIARVMKQCPRASHVLSAVILNNAIAHARVSHN